MKLVRKTLMLFVALTVLAACNQKQPTAASVETEGVDKTTVTTDEQATDYYTALDRYLAEQIAARYAPGEYSVPLSDVVAVNDEDSTDIRIWGDFWVYNYCQVGDTLKCVSGGSHPGLMHICQKGEHFYVRCRRARKEQGRRSADIRPRPRTIGHHVPGRRLARKRTVSMDFKNKIAVITGGAQGIGRCIAEEFQKAGATVCVIDKQEGNHYVGDLADKQVLEQFAKEVIEKHEHIDYLINNALPLMKGIDECTYEEFQYALSVGVTAPFYLAKLFAPYFAEGASIVNISSSRDRMSQPQTESYTAAKGGIAALTHALAVSLAGKVRVNSISPGWIDTAYTVYQGPDAIQQPAGRVGNPLDIANMVLYLCSDKAGFITGENICIDGGMTRLMIYHGDNGWNLETTTERML